MRHLLAVLFAVSVLGLPWLYMNDPVHFQYVISAVENVGAQLASVILAHNPKTIAQIQGKYTNSGISFFPNQNAQKVRILLVPGHEPDYGGAEYDSPYGHVRERDFTVELAQDLQGFLAKDPHYQTFITRDTKAWNPIFADYFKNDWNDIITWQKASKGQFSQMIANGSTPLQASTVDHVTVPDNVAMRLYGITKWANENDIDIEIHIHFNDYPGHAENQPGKYTGFAVYVPAAQYENSSTTRLIADAVLKRLTKYNPVSNYPKESAGVVDDRELIAVGANNTADAASMLIEYSYIYEPQLDDPATRSLFIKDLAYQTYLGLGDFFNKPTTVGLAAAYDTLMLPHQWSTPITSDDTPADVFALQSALMVDGDYPPENKTINTCPRTGGFGPCTKAALQIFQMKNGIKGEQGFVGPKTIQTLNQQFGVKITQSS